ncbi:MAG: hypothetical protein R6V00_11445 [Candidatus Aminicenantes bacterium]
MHEKLKKYLGEISHYLAAVSEKEEILTEIKSHILEKTEQEFGEINEEAIDKVIDTYGCPREVAEKYTEGFEIIAPSFKGHLLRYTGVLFALHFSLTLLSFIFKTSFFVLPFFYIPKIDSFQELFYVPMSFVYDLGLVGLILYFVTQSRKDVRLPWINLKINWLKITKKRQAQSRVIPFILMLLGYAALVWIYLRFNTLFFKTINLQKAESLLTPAASQWYSSALLALLGIGLAGYGIKFLYTSEWVNLLRSGFQLVILGIVINKPIETPFIKFPFLDLPLIANIILTVILVWVAIDFLKSLLILGRKAFFKKPSQKNSSIGR